MNLSPMTMLKSLIRSARGPIADSYSSNELVAINSLDNITRPSWPSSPEIKVVKQVLEGLYASADKKRGKVDLNGHDVSYFLSMISAVFGAQSRNNPELLQADLGRIINSHAVESLRNPHFWIGFFAAYTQTGVPLEHIKHLINVANDRESIEVPDGTDLMVIFERYARYMRSEESREVDGIGRAFRRVRKIIKATADTVVKRRIEHQGNYLVRYRNLRAFLRQRVHNSDEILQDFDRAQRVRREGRND